MFWSQKKEKAALDAAIEAAAKPATELIVEKAPDGYVFPATATHFGGNPYFEDGDRWPMLPGEDRPYDFVFQVNLNDCPVRPNVPFDLFTVFLCWAALDHENAFELACVVKTYRDASLAKAVLLPRPLPRDPEDYRVRLCNVRTGTFTTYPCRMDGFPAIVAAASKFRNPSTEFAAALRRMDIAYDCRSRIGGFPRWVHDNTLEGDALIFLAQIDYEPDANNCIGDAAPIYIAASESDPTRIETDVFQSH